MTARGPGPADPAGLDALRGAALVHELRQPLFAIHALAQLLELELEGPALERLRELRSQAARAAELVDHYAGLGGAAEAVVPVDLREAAHAAVRALTPRAHEVGARIALEAPEAPRVRARPLAVHQVLVNLLANALDAVAAAPVREVRVRVEPEGGWARVAIDDTGPGIDARVRDRAFDPLVTTRPAADGAAHGLGLAIVARLVAEGGGGVVLGDAPGGGARAEARWPLDG